MFLFRRKKTDEQPKEQSLLLDSVKRPFDLCWKNPINSILWFLFTIIGGLLGLIINYIQRCVFGNMTWVQSVYVDSVIGNFYTYALVLISATLGALFMGMVDTKPPHFRKQKMLVAAIFVFVMLLNAIFYSMQAKESVKGINLNDLDKLDYKIDYPQTIFFCLAILFAIYALGIQYMDKNPEKHADLDDYSQKEKDNVSGLIKSKTEKSPEGYDI